MAYRVLVSDKLAEAGIEKFKAQSPDLEVDVKVGLKPEELKEIIGNYDGLAIRSNTKVTPDILSAATRLKVVGRAGIGVDNVDLPAATQKGVLVMNTPDGNVITTAEHAISLMCALSRKVPQATASMKAGKWEKSKFQGRELTGKTLGVVGLGNIGKIVASRGLGLHMVVAAYDPFVTKERARELGVELVSLEDLLSRSDYVTLHVPLLDATRNLISKERIALMKDGAFLINAARGGLVDEVAAAEALRSGKLSGAAFDVYAKEPPDADHPFLQLDNVVLTPHLGASTSEAQVNVSVSVAEQIIAYLTTGAIQNAVNAPAVTADLMETIGPYLGVGERLGQMAGQIHPGSIGQVRVTYAGKLSELSLEAVTATVLTGLLKKALGPEINQVSASFLAKERGIDIVEEKKTKSEDFAGTITLRVSGDAATTEVTGTLMGGDPRIVDVNGFRLEIVPDGFLLMTKHRDRPGIIGAIGTLLGKHKVNISRMTLGKPVPGSELASAVISVDGAIADEALTEISQIDGIESAKTLVLA